MIDLLDLTAVATPLTFDDGGGDDTGEIDDVTAQEIIDAIKADLPALVRAEIDANSTKLDAAVSTRSTYAGGPVASVTAGVTIADASITSAKFTVAAPSAGLPTGILEKLDRVFRRFYRKTTRDSENIYTYADDGTTVLTTQAYSAASTDEEVGAAS